MYVINDLTNEEISYAFEISEIDIHAAFEGLIEIMWISEDEQSVLDFYDNDPEAYEWLELAEFEGFEEDFE